MTGYCLVRKEKECAKAREEVLKQYNGRLPEKFKHTALDSCLYCGSFME